MSGLIWSGVSLIWSGVSGLIGSGVSSLIWSGVSLIWSGGEWPDLGHFVSQVMANFYSMLPPATDGSAEDSAAPNVAGLPFSLITALQMSLVGETPPSQGGGGGEEGAGERSSVAVRVPEDLAVDLRAKLAICLIHMGVALPEAGPHTGHSASL